VDLQIGTRLILYNMICIFTGLPGAGKSYKMARTVVDILYRNKKWYQQTGIKRQIVSNLKLSPHIEVEFEGFIRYWSDPSELVALRNVDLFWDEIATHLDSTQWQNMPLSVKRWLQQHRQFGVEVYGTTQDFAMIDKSMRRMTSDLVHLVKVFGTRDKSATKPDPKYVFCLVLMKTLDPTTYDEENKSTRGIPKFMLITREGIDVFDTTQEILAGEYPPLNHIERECLDPDCAHGLLQKKGNKQIRHA